ncbi:hypothetical protein F9U64_13950 [Gracilibacillus oryzae]|uniref:Uncharacterized protein n=1 Tax=Gracilibacillus oryzae TaxID=1672701 RepID=A0A7C8GSW8_9BACI|nr:hypothetical protein [Gracilibacillus oryzae]KAB8130730.1 hypothetical protein F9U64_13950 [Gracilibacillus oryzae]
MKKYELSFAVVASVITIAFLLVVNLITSTAHLWFIYPAFVILFWPVSLYSLKKGKHKQFSILCSLLLIAFLVVMNYINTPEYPWVIFGLFPILWWPILVLLGDRAKTIQVALIGSSSIILYYICLNIIMGAQHPWVIYPAFVVLWWPLAVYHGQRKSYFAFSIQASILISVFFITVNAITSPQAIWAIYPIFCVLWWPLSMYYFVYKKKAGI